jgi:hypothetical protein
MQVHPPRQASDRCHCEQYETHAPPWSISQWSLQCTYWLTLLVARRAVPPFCRDPVLTLSVRYEIPIFPYSLPTHIAISIGLVIRRSSKDGHEWTSAIPKSYDTHRDCERYFRSVSLFGFLCFRHDQSNSV